MLQGFTDKFKKAIDNSRLSIKEISKRSGVAEATLRQAYNGYYNPCAKTLAAICQTLKISADWLLGLSIVKPAGIDDNEREGNKNE
jgi:Helix-turn-helix.